MYPFCPRTAPAGAHVVALLEGIETKQPQLRGVKTEGSGAAYARVPRQDSSAPAMLLFSASPLGMDVLVHEFMVFVGVAQSLLPTALVAKLLDDSFQEAMRVPHLPYGIKFSKSNSR